MRSGNKITPDHTNRGKVAFTDSRTVLATLQAIFTSISTLWKVWVYGYGTAYRNQHML